MDKPAGPTSHDIVVRARRALGVRRIGHAGTLDPFATGLLLLCVGPATRLVRYLHLLDKRYRARLRLGVETDTLDPDGEVTNRSEGWREVEAERLASALEPFKGLIEQVPPAFSAVKVEGRRAHRAARAGEAVELEPRPVRVESLRLVSFEPPEAEIEAVVGTGTYMRALARDIGRRLGCGAHLTSLRRTAVGPYAVEEAVGLEDLDRLTEANAEASPAWRGPAAALAWLPVRDLSAAEAERVRHGDRVPARGVAAPERAGGGAPVEAGGAVALLLDGDLVAVAESEDGELQPRTVFGAA